MVRENSCIDGDDDIDIITDKNNYDIIKEILKENNIQVYTGGYNEKCFNAAIKKRIKQKKIIKTKPTSEYVVDIYMGDFKDGNVYDMWNCLTIKDCFLDKEKETFIENTWNGQKIYYPNDYERILLNRYGRTWTKKINRKVGQTMKVLKIFFDIFCSI